jgi:RNA polymerase sigma-70 factor (ECF subfamily)
MDIDQDSRLIIRILKGEREAYAEIVDEYKMPIFNLAYRMIGDRFEAQDLAQEAFLNAYKNLADFDVQKPFFPWLYTIALNLIRNHLKKKRPLVMGHIERTHFVEEKNLADNAETQLVEHQKREKISQAIQQLPLIHREVIILRYYQEFSFKEIADILDVSLSAAKMRVYRALKVLSQTITKRFFVE